MLETRATRAEQGGACEAPRAAGEEVSLCEGGPFGRFLANVG